MNIYRKSPRTCWNSQTLTIFVLVSLVIQNIKIHALGLWRFRGHDSEVQCTRQTYWKGQRTAKWRPCKGQGSDLCTGPRPFCAKNRKIPIKRKIWINLSMSTFRSCQLYLTVKKQTNWARFKHKEAFSTLVECLYKWHTFISRIFLKIGWVTV